MRCVNQPGKGEHPTVGLNRSYWRGEQGGVNSGGIKRLQPLDCEPTQKGCRYACGEAGPLALKEAPLK
jgi:hypothetical protein